MSEDQVPSGNRPATDPVGEGLAVLVPVSPLITLPACAECGVLLWDVEAHWTDAHAHRLQALRANAARG